MDILVRPIVEKDNRELASIIRQVLTEYGANRPGFAWQDPELDNMYEAYSKHGYYYMVATIDDEVVGGAGIGLFSCELERVCELQKMYLLPIARGQGIGDKLLSELLTWSGREGYDKCYLETLESMREARRLYKRHYFQPLNKPLGNSGHSACDSWYIKQLVT